MLLLLGVIFKSFSIPSLNTFNEILWDFLSRILDSKSENNQNSQETITEDKEIKDQKSNKSSVDELATELDDDIPF